MITGNTHNSLASPQVLIVDDDIFTLEIVKRLLQSYGISQVIVCENGAEGLEVVKAAPGAIDILILDLNMPKMDGIEFIQQLDEKIFTGSLILSSGEDAQALEDAEGLAQARNLRTLGYLKKPITRAALKDILGLP
jgi:CheY-like chemotaxis protein